MIMSGEIGEQIAMNEKKEKVFYVTTHSGDDPERASVPFTLGKAALAMDIDATIFLHGNGVWLATKGYAKHVRAEPFESIEKLMESFLELGGKLLVCVPCLQARNIDEAELIEGVELAAAGRVTEEMFTAQVHLVF